MMLLKMSVLHFMAMICKLHCNFDIHKFWNGQGHNAAQVFATHRKSDSLAIVMHAIQPN